MDMDAESLKEALSNYETAFAKKVSGKKSDVAKELTGIDQWMRLELPGLIGDRKPPHVTSEDLSRLMKWKLGRGKFRPRLQQLAESNAADSVKAASTAGFQIVETDLGKAIEALCVLKGVGPATASLILSVAAPQKAPFMSDEAVGAVRDKGGKIDYTLPVYLDYAKKLVQLQKRLNKELKGVRGDVVLSAAEVERGLWARQILGDDMTEPKKAEKNSNKRSINEEKSRKKIRS